MVLGAVLLLLAGCRACSSLEQIAQARSTAIAFRTGWRRLAGDTEQLLVVVVERIIAGGSKLGCAPRVRHEPAGHGSHASASAAARSATNVEFFGRPLARLAADQCVGHAQQVTRLKCHVLRSAAVLEVGTHIKQIARTTGSDYSLVFGRGRGLSYGDVNEFLAICHGDENFLSRHPVSTAAINLKRKYQLVFVISVLKSIP